MRALRILQGKLGDLLGFLHAKRSAALWRVVEGLLEGQELWLTKLGRSLPGNCSAKHRVKAVDRFIGNPAIQAAVPGIYAGLAEMLLGSVKHPIVLVDWTAAEPDFYVLSAQIAFEGRALPILSRTYPEQKKANPDVERAFLSELKTILPAHCQPVLVTDAGFLFKWIDSVRECGWDYVCRARFKEMNVTIDGHCMKVREAYGLATGKPRDLGTVVLGTGNPRAHRAVLSATPKLKGRKKLGRRGRPLTGGVPSACRAAAREPLLLITSLADPARIVVDIYRMRMQIEQTFRDLKSYRYGWSTRHIRTTRPERFDVLLLVAAIAAIAMHLAGLAIRGGVLARGLQANTERRRKVFSTFFLGKLALGEGLDARIPARSFREALASLFAMIPSLERVSA